MAFLFISSINDTSWTGVSGVYAKLNDYWMQVFWECTGISTLDESYKLCWHCRQVLL